MKKRIFCLKSNFTKLIVTALLCLGLVPGTSNLSFAAQSVKAVRGDFKNSFFSGGHVLKNENGVTLKSSSFGLVSSSLGQIVAKTIPYPDFEKDAANKARKMLYYESGDATGDFAKDKAAFRYKVLLYEKNANGITARFDNMGKYWTENDRSRALEAGKIILDALKYNPYYKDLRSLLLDIYYDIAVADLTKATDKMVEANKAAMGPPLGLASEDGFQISLEIQHVKDALDLYEKAIKPYFGLLNDPMGIDMSRVDADAAAKGKPFGYYLFEKEVPSRSAYALSYKNGDKIEYVIEDETLFSGYKDLVLLFNVERDLTRTAVKLAKLYAMRSGAGDMENARSLIQTMQQKIYTDGIILNRIFPECESDCAESPSGLTEAKAGWSHALTELSGARNFVEGNANPLGFDKDFLVLCYDTDTSGTQIFKDTYQFFENRLFPSGQSPGGQLSYAVQKYDEAVAKYEKVQMNKDQIASELEGIRNQYGLRLQKIVGKDPAQSGYETSSPTAGSEISIQNQNIELAKLRIVRNQTEMDNLLAQINNEIERRGKEAGINDLIGNTIIEYGDKQVKLTKRIAQISASQAMANATEKALSSFASSINVENPIGGIVGGVAALANGAFQANAELLKGKYSAKKEKLAAEQSAKIHYLSDQISDATSEARVKDLLLGMNTLEVDSLEAAMMVAQETSRLQALYEEKTYLETRWKESEANLADRYFADPVHRFLSDKAIIEAGFAFDEAQKWVFMMARALDYRLNQRFTAVGADGKAYISETVFRLRNAEELEKMVRAIYNHASLEKMGERAGQLFVKYSLREDVFGFRAGSGVKYPDPKTGTMVSALEAFRSYLKNIAYNGKSEHLTNFEEVVRISFNTVGTNLVGTFFSNGVWNEKIKWIAVKINTSSVSYPSVQIYMEQSGIGFVRNKTRGTVDPKHPDQLKNEMTGYPIRQWFYENNQWKSKPSFGFSSISAEIIEDPDKEPVTWQKAEFHELSPAVSKWTIEIPTKDRFGQPLVKLDALSDIEIWFCNYYIARNYKRSSK